MTLRAAAITLGALLLSPSAVVADEAAPDAPIAEGIVAVVDGEPLLWSDLRHAAAIEIAVARASPAGERAPRMREALRAGLERLIEDTLLIREAARLEIVVTADEMSRALEAVAREQGYETTERLMAAVAASYGDVDYRLLLSRVLLRGKVVQHHLAMEIPRRDGSAAAMTEAEGLLLADLAKAAVIERRLTP